MENLFLDGLMFSNKQLYIDYIKLFIRNVQFDSAGYISSYEAINQNHVNNNPECFEYLTRVHKTEWDLFDGKIKSNRYFLVFFIAEKDGDTITSKYDTLEGHISLQTQNGKFLNRDMCIMMIKRTGLKNVIIRSLTELSESDYNDWVSTSEG